MNCALEFRPCLLSPDDGSVFLSYYFRSKVWRPQQNPRTRRTVGSDSKATSDNKAAARDHLPHRLLRRDFELAGGRFRGGFLKSFVESLARVTTS